MPEWQRATERAIRDAVEGQAVLARQQDQAEIERLRQERARLLGERDETDGLRRKLQETEHLLQQRTHDLDAWRGYTESLIAMEQSFLEAIWIERGLTTPSLTDKGAIELSGIDGLTADERGRVARLPAPEQHKLHGRIVDRLQAEGPIRQCQRILATENGTSLLQRGYRPFRLEATAAPELVAEKRQQLGAMDDLTLLRTGIVTWAALGQAQQNIRASRTMAKIRDLEGVTNGYQEIAIRLRSRNLPLPSQSRSPRPSQRHQDRGGYER